MNATHGDAGGAFSSEDSLPTMVPGGRAESFPPVPAKVFDEPQTEGSIRTARGIGADSGDGPAIGRIDQYDLLRKLGGGGFGVVYLAHDTVSGLDVALKTLHPLLKHNAEEMDLLREKFALVARLTHQNVAKALVLHPCQRIDVWDEAARRELRLSPGDFVMVMDFAPGVTLSNWRRQFPGGRVPLPLALEVARQVAAALDYAHGERIVHRDVKPGNIMVETVEAEPRPSDHGHGRASSPSAPALVTRHSSPVTSKIRVRILDFGLAAEIRSSMSRVSTESGDTSGTRPYMAPEQWLGRRQDGRTDQYALACVLYEMLSGAPPFAGVFETGDPVIMRTAVTTDAPEGIEGYDTAVNAALLKALAKNPKERFSSCAEFVDALLPALGRARSPSAPQPPSAARSENAPSRSALDDPSSEAEVLRRKVQMARTLKNLPAEDRSDAELSAFAEEADMELETAEEAFRYSRFAAAAQCLDRADAALRKLAQTKADRKAREEAERKAHEEAERKAREEAERRRLVDQVRLATERAEREQQEAFKRAKEEAGRRAREEAERKAREAADRRAWEKEEAERKVAEVNQKKTLGKVILAFVAVFLVIRIGVDSSKQAEAERQTQFAREEKERKAQFTREATERSVRKNHEHGKVQLWEGGPYWAETNIGADKPEDYGLYFWWGDTVGNYYFGGKRLVLADSHWNFSFCERTTPTYDKDNATLRRGGWTTSEGILASEHDAAHVHWGGAWRLPTEQDFSDLSSNCDWMWTKRNGVEGYVVRGRGAYTDSSIFLPAAGYGYGTSLFSAGSYGLYWSSIPYESDSDHAWYLRFDSGRHFTYDYRRDYGFPVRPVQRFTEW